MWREIIRILNAAGHTQRALAAYAGVGQSSICRLADGRTRDPRFSTGLALVDLAGGPERLASEFGIEVRAGRAPPGAVAIAVEVPL
jgi:hypothetical protein